MTVKELGAVELAEAADAILRDGHVEAVVCGVSILAELEHLSRGRTQLIVTTSGSPAWLRVGPGRAPFEKDELVTAFAGHVAHHLSLQ